MVESAKESQLIELQNRFAELENDRREHYESTMNAIKSNKKTIDNMKVENKELRFALQHVAMEKDQKIAAEKKGELAPDDSPENELERMHKNLASLRKRYDDLRYKSERDDADLSKLKKQLRDLDKASVKPLEDSSSPLTQTIRKLENKLDKAMMKYNEAFSVQQTYEGIAKRLKEERIGFDLQVEAMEDQLRSKNHDHEELLMMAQDANHSKETARLELQQMHHSVSQQREKNRRELAERQRLVEQRLEISKRQSALAAQRRDVELEGQGDLSKAGEDRLKISSLAHVFHGHNAEKSMESEVKKITSYEEAWRKIKEGTGLDDPAEVINKYFANEATNQNLNQMTKEAQERLDKMVNEKQVLEDELGEVKYSGNAGVQGSKRAIDSFDDSFLEAENKTERARKKLERVTRNLVFSKAGIGHLKNKLIHAELPDNPLRQSLAQFAEAQMSDDNVVEILLYCGKVLGWLFDETLPEESNVPSTTMADGIYGSLEEPDIPNNTRIGWQLQANEDFDEDNEAEDDIEVSDRFQIKKIAANLIEKATKKKKTKKKRAVE